MEAQQVSEKIVIGLKVCMITPCVLPITKPIADSIRFFNIKSQLTRKGAEVIVVSRNTRLTFEVARENNLVDYKVPAINVRWLWEIAFMLLLVPTLIKVCKKEKIDIIFVNSGLCGVPLYFYAKLKNKTIIHYDVMGIAFREALLSPSRMYGFIKSIYHKVLDVFMLKSAAFITTINEIHKKKLTSLTRKKIYILRDAVDEIKFDPDRIRCEINCGKTDAIHLLFVGGLNNRKLDLLFNILPQAINMIPNLHVSIIGMGNDYTYYTKRALDFDNISSHIHFHGYVSDEIMLQHLKMADMAFSDFWTQIGFPAKVFNYMAMGKAVLVPDAEAIREILTDGVNCLLYKDGEDLLKKIMLLAQNKEVREVLGRNARELVLREHTWRKKGDELFEIYQQYCNS